jgi:DNA-binding NtrC family response regulator
MARILVVDDEPLARDLIKRRLERDGHTVDTAENELVAQKMISEADPPYDVVVTDMVMNSEMSGLEVLKAALLRDIFTEVIVLTAYGSIANAVECMKRGAYDYVEKNIPGVDVYDLLAMKVERALEERKGILETLKRLRLAERLLSQAEGR